MDLLLGPSQHDLTPAIVPYLPSFVYDGLAYAAFPSRTGFEKDGQLDIDMPCLELAAFAQAWLYFGLLETLTTLSNIHKKLTTIVDDGSNIVVETSKLDRLLAGSLPAGQFLQLDQSSALATAREASNRLRHVQDPDERMLLDEHTQPANLDTISKSQKEKGLMLHNVVYGQLKKWQPISKLLPRFVPVLDHGPEQRSESMNHSLVQNLLQMGWCIHHATRICRKQNTSVLRYLAGIKRTDVVGVSHDACSEQTCVAYHARIDDSYTVRHVQADCNCEFLTVPKDIVHRIAHGGGIPLVHPWTTPDGTIRLEVIEAIGSDRYIAISHVWADGLGNPTSNSLPRCQLQRLTRLLTKISDDLESGHGRHVLRVKKMWRSLIRKRAPLLFWMDTLCIPVGPNSEIARRRAIQRMALIYAGADGVLVLDHEHRFVDRRVESKEKLYARMLISKWNTRCWTLQEAVLARKLFWEFGQEIEILQPANMSSISRHSPAASQLISPGDGISQLLIKAVKAQVRTSDPGAVLVKSKKIGRLSLLNAEINFLGVWNELGQRSTTKINDIHVMLANLTDFSAGQIMAIPSQVERTKVMFFCHGSFPLDIMWNEGIRPDAGEDNANRWIPAIPGPEPLEDSTNILFTDVGLVFEPGLGPLPPQILVVERDPYSPYICLQYDDGPNQQWLRVECREVPDDKIQREMYHGSCYIIRGENAARFLIVNQQIPWHPQSDTLLLRYDCAASVRSVSKLALDGMAMPIVTANSQVAGRKIVIEHQQNSDTIAKIVRRSK